MDPQHRELLASNCARLADMIDLNENVLCFLILRKVFTPPMLSDILSKESEKAKKEELISELRTRGPSAFNEFMNILVATKQTEAVALLQGKELCLKPIQDDKKKHSSGFEGDMQLVVKTAKEPKVGPELFKMTSNPRGKCLIINNIDFGNIKEKRIGSEKDGMKLDKVFSQLYYDVILRCDRKASEMKELLEKFSRDPEHKLVDSCVVIILSHGSSGLVYGVDGKEVLIEQILALFNNENCPGLKGKPKIFFIQACRGSNCDRGVSRFESTDAGAVHPFKSTERIPTYTDMLIVYSTVDGYVSVCHHNMGSWFCQELVNVLIDHACDTDLVTILKLVDKRVQERELYKGNKQSTEFTGRGWNKTFYFNPGFTTL